MSATELSKPRIHSALTADEAREAIVLDFSNQLRSKLISAGLEGSHTTFVNAEWVGGVRVKAFLRKPIDVKVVGSLGEQGESDEELEASASISRQVKNPETVRGELHAGPYEMRPVSEVFPDETISDLPPTTGVVKGFTDESQFEVSDSEFPLTDVVEKRDTQQTEEAPFTLLNGELPKSGVDLSEIESEIVETHDTFVDGMAEALKDTPLESVFAPKEPGASALCQFCSTPLSDYPPAKISHMRTHVRKNEAIEFIDGNGEKAWRPM